MDTASSTGPPRPSQRHHGVPLLHSPPPQYDTQHMAVSLNYGYLFGIFAMNVVSDILFIAIGVVGILCMFNTVTITSVFFSRIARIAVPLKWRLGQWPLTGSLIAGSSGPSTNAK